MIPAIRPLIFIPVIIILLSPTFVSGETAQDWLMKIQYAAGKQNYIGVFVYRHSNQLESMRIIHQVKDGKIRERIISLNGVPREIIRVDNVVWRYLPDKKNHYHKREEARQKIISSFITSDNQQTVG